MTNETQIVSLEKEFNASKEALYRAWTDEASLKQWWKPMGKTLARVENDIRPGGKVAYTFDNDLTIQGEYKEAQPGEKLVYSWVWDLPDDSAHKGEYLLTVAFNGEGDNSRLAVRQEAFQNEHSVQPHREGWEQALDDLKRFVESGQ